LPASREPATAQKLTELAIEPVGSTMAEFADVMNAERISYRDALIITNLLKKE
jgi:hypothetical protein